MDDFAQTSGDVLLLGNVVFHRSRYVRVCADSVGE